MLPRWVKNLDTHLILGLSTSACLTEAPAKNRFWTAMTHLCDVPEKSLGTPGSVIVYVSTCLDEMSLVHNPRCKCRVEQQYLTTAHFEKRYWNQVRRGHLIVCGQILSLDSSIPDHYERLHGGLIDSNHLPWSLKNHCLTCRGCRSTGLLAASTKATSRGSIGGYVSAAATVVVGSKSGRRLSVSKSKSKTEKQ